MKLLNFFLGKSPVANVHAQITAEQSALRKFSAPLNDHADRLVAAKSAFFSDPSAQKFERWLALEVQRDAVRRMTQDVLEKSSEIRSTLIRDAIPTMRGALDDILAGLNRRRDEIAAEDQARTAELGVDASRPAVLAELDRQIERLEVRRLEININPNSAFVTISEFTDAK